MIGLVLGNVCSRLGVLTLQLIRPHIALMSLPALFGTELHSFRHMSYLKPGSALVLEHLRLEPPPGGLNVGLVWASNPENKQMYRNKSMPVEVLMPLLSDLLNLGLIELHSLQFGNDADQLKPCQYEWN